MSSAKDWVNRNSFATQAEYEAALAKQQAYMDQQQAGATANQTATNTGAKTAITNELSNSPSGQATQSQQELWNSLTGGLQVPDNYGSTAWQNSTSGSGSVDPENIFGSGQPGEIKLTGAIVSPLNAAYSLTKQAYDQAVAKGEVPQGVSAQDYINQMLPIFQKAMGITDDDMAADISKYNELMQPGRTQQTNALASTLGAMGMGGGRLARALASANRGFAADTGTYAQSLQGQNRTANQSLSNNLLSNWNQNQTNLLTEKTGLLGQLANIQSSISQTPAQAMLAYKQGE